MMKIFERKGYQVLILPDDNAEPTHVRFGSHKMTLIWICAFILSVHFVLGMIFYVRFARLHRENKTLVATNKLLKEDNQRIYNLENTFAVIEESQRKIRQVLGLGPNDSTVAISYAHQSTESQPPNELPMYLSHAGDEPISVGNISEPLTFLKTIQSPYHDQVPNIPTLLPVNGWLTSGFEDVNRKGEVHQGVDLAAERGAVVRAAGNGVVIFSNWTHDLGNLVIIYHGNDFFSFYGHNQTLLKLRGSVVKKGDPIALVGSTGRSTAPHLHFEIWKGGVPIDPTKLIFSLRDTNQSRS